MDILKHINEDYFQPIGGIQEYHLDEKYVLASYCSFVEMGNLIAIYNNLLRGLIVIAREEYNAIFTEKNLIGKQDIEMYLVNNWYYIKETIDTVELANKVKEFAECKMDEHYLNPKEIIGYTILPTTDCNARCFYCYEKGRSRIKMSNETAKKIGEYILSHSTNIGKDQPIDLRWFGGEPLYNTDAIDIICKTLKDAGKNYASGMISNGYLFTDEVLEKATTLWRLNDVQITLDGTEKTYNKTKNYIYKDGRSAFNVVLESIEKLLKAKIHVVVRMNIDMYNAEDAKDLVNMLYKRFGTWDGLFNAYAYPLFEDVKGFERTDEKRKEVYRQFKELIILCNYYGYGAIRGLNDFIPSAQCMVDGGHSILFSPNGEIGLCEHYTESEFFGHIDKPESEWDWDMIKSWHEHSGPIDICQSCPLWPECVYPKKCQQLAICNQQMKEWRNFEKDHAIRKFVKEYYKNRRYGDTNINNSDCDCGNGNCNCGNNINGELVNVIRDLKEGVWQMNNGIQKMHSELELANDYRGLSLKNRIKVLLGMDVDNPHAETSDNQK